MYALWYKGVMKETVAGIVFISLWIGGMLLWSGSNKTDVRDYSNPATDTPCEFNDGRHINC